MVTQAAKYQCLNKGVNIIVRTRHNSKLKKTESKSSKNSINLKVIQSQCFLVKRQSTT